MTGSPTRPPAGSIRPTLLAGNCAGASPAHGRAATTMDTAAATASADPAARRAPAPPRPTRPTTAARGRPHSRLFGRRGRHWDARVVTVGRVLAGTRPVQRRVVGQDGGVQALQRLGGVDAQF